jgi:succinate-semialdehyde dehydrogenase/glutarate-semialdehyde dehydrogenase
MSHKMQSVNPATGAREREYVGDTDAQLEEKLARGAAAAGRWRKVPVEQRGKLMRRAAEVLQKNKSTYAGLMVTEMGKPITQAEAEIEKCATACHWFADHAARLLQSEDHPSDAARSYVRFDPLGMVLAIMPWNFPFWQCIRFAAPGLMAGNVGVLKHADNVPGCALAIESLFTEAGFPEGCFQTLMISVERTDEIIADPRIAAVTLTGSERAGRIVGREAGGALKKIVLELGGSDPFIVLKDADIARAAQVAALARCNNSGQSCIAAKRFILVPEVYDAFAAALVKEMGRLVVGEPMDRATQVGPLAREDLRDKLTSQVRHSVAGGAHVLLGGGPTPSSGFYYPPTILGNVAPGMAAFDEETFGPVAALVRAKNEEDAIRLANFSHYGLGASIWTKDIARAEAIAPDIDAGSVFINGMVKSIPSLPFGGIKASGHGRELSEVGIREFVNIKTVWVGVGGKDEG